VAGRRQGDSRPPRGASVRLRLVAGTLVAGVLAASAAIGAVEVLPRVEDSVARDSKLTAFERRHAAGNRLGLDPAPFARFRLGLSAGERYAVDVPPGAKGPFITRGEVVRAYSAFFFLPAIQVQKADRVFHYRFP
jgi:hypothetical protein